VQTTPLLNRQGDIIGALSTHWAEPHILSDRDARLLDLLTQQASSLISRLRSEETLHTNALQLEQQAAELRSHDQHKNEFLGMLSHELRNPLAAMVSSLQALTAMPAGDERQTPLLAMLENQCQHMARLVGDLLDISRINSGKVMLYRQPVRLQEIITASITALQPQIDSRQHQLTLDLPEQPVWLDADPARIRQVISNLLFNAAKYTDAGGRLGLSVQPARDNGEVLIIIEDNGIGLTAGALSNIFEPFTQVQQPQQQFQDGLGLGLALVRQLVELHGGTVSAYSDGPGRGSRFDVRLPVLKEAPLPDQDVVHTGESAPVISRRILLVDDNVSITTALEVLLQMNGHEVRIVNDSSGALAAAREFRPDVALIDIAMPGMNGMQVARQLRTELADQPMKLIAVTGYGAEEDVSQIKAAGFDIHLLKPVQLAELQAAIDSVSK
jgi:signal transduction histidine kinase